MKAITICLTFCLFGRAATVSADELELKSILPLVPADKAKKKGNL